MSRKVFPSQTNKVFKIIPLLVTAALSSMGASQCVSVNKLKKETAATSQTSSRAASATLGNWKYLSGTPNASAFADYGTQGVAGPTVQPGGRTAHAFYSSKLPGKLLIFGGYGRESSSFGHLNDVFSYDYTTAQYTWLTGANYSNPGGSQGTLGVPSAANSSMNRTGFSYWSDSAGDIYIFGGEISCCGTQRASDLLKFDPATLEWTWVKGPDSSAWLIGDPGTYGTQGTADASNNPAARQTAGQSKDSSGNLWMFGGYNNNSSGAVGYLNDLWKYAPLTNEWTWISGSNLFGNLSGVYGTKGTGSTANLPGSRHGALIWFDENDILYLFGGQGYDEAGSLGSLSDLWKFNPTTLEWTWLNGSKIVDQYGVYGTQGVASASNWPGGRFSGQQTSAYRSSTKTLWMYGGYGFGKTTGPNSLGDLWSFDMTTLQWTFQKGFDEVNQAGVFGVAGEGSPTYVPATRQWAAVTYIPTIGALSVFGGSNPAYDIMNDHWIISIP